VWSEYYDQFAPFYDRIYGDYQEDLPFYLGLAKQAPHQILDVGCGTGRILIPLAAEGNRVTGMDYSQQMLDICKKKILARHFAHPPELVLADMQTITFRREFSLVIVPFRSFLHLPTQSAQIKTLQNFKQYLLPGGCLIISLFVPKVKILHVWDQQRTRLPERDFRDPQGHRIEVSQVLNYDTLNQVCNWTYTFEKTNRKGKILETQTITGGCRYIWKNEFELMLKLVGFQDWTVYGGFNYEPLTEDSEEMVWIIR